MMTPWYIDLRWLKHGFFDVLWRIPQTAWTFIRQHKRSPMKRAYANTPKGQIHFYIMGVASPC